MAAVAQRTSDSVQLHDSWVRIFFSASGSDFADFHYQWLRHNCDLDRHPTTNERTVCSSELSAQPQPEALWIEPDSQTLHVEWKGEQRTSQYDLKWLRDHAYAYSRDTVPPPPHDPAPLSFDATGLPLDELVARLRAQVDEHGLGVVRNYGLDTETLIDAIDALDLKIRPTHFGRIEDLRTDNTTNQNTDQLGYTDYPVKLHTDQPFLEEPPEYQLLQSMRKAITGGENYVVDAEAAARYLQSIDRQAYELLTMVPVTFHRKQKNFEKTLVSPMISQDASGRFIIRYSYFTLAPHKVPFDVMENWYRAYNRFADLVNDPRHQYHVGLNEGDFLMYNNRRMLHARNGFSGPRWVRGIYFDRR